MMELHLIKQPGGLLRPANQADADLLEGVKNGALLVGTFKQPRNPYFHRKFFALLNFAFEYFDPELIEIESLKITPEKNFERFRKDVTILAGYRTLVVNIKGESRFEAASISFAKMDEAEFSQLYKAVFNVCWRMVLQKVKDMTPELVENTINQMISFD